MITKEQALSVNVFHDDRCKNWRRNGKTQTWKTEPDRFRVPVKFGLYTYSQITPSTAAYYHVPGTERCVSGLECGR